MKHNTAIHAEWPMSVAITFTFLPWIAMVLFTAGPWAALNFFGYAILVIAVGYSVVCGALPASARAQTIFLAPALGILAISALTAFCLRLGLPLTWVLALWLGLMAAGAVSLWSDRALWAKSSVGYGGALVVLSVLICAVFFLPSARNDAVMRRDGSFNWIYVDTQYFHSVAASIKNSNGPPKTPGTSTEELRYHFGPYAPAAAISRLDGLELGDAFARVTRGGSLWALVLSCFGLGTLLSLKANGGKFGGVMSVTGLFFYGSLLSLFTNELNGSSYVTGAILSRDSQRRSTRRWRALQPSDPRAFNATRLRSCYSDHGGMPDSKGAGNIPKLARVHIGGAACVRCLSELGGCPLLPGHSMHSLVLGAARRGAFMMQNNDNRWYSPQAMVRLSQDPLGYDAGDTNLYRYCGNSVTNTVDPTGTDRWIVHNGCHWWIVVEVWQTGKVVGYQVLEYGPWGFVVSPEGMYGGWAEAIANTGIMFHRARQQSRRPKGRIWTRI